MTPNQTISPPILNLNIEIDAKTEIKAERVLNQIVSRIETPIHLREIYSEGTNVFSADCFIVSKYQSTNDSIVWTLETLEKMGKGWYIDSLKLNYNEYWIFTGSRLNDWGEFKIPGIMQMDFQLTNQQKDPDILKIIN